MSAAKRVRAKCDYCHQRRLLDPATRFCTTCVEEWNDVTDTYCDGDPLLPLKVAMAEVARRSRSAIARPARGGYNHQASGSRKK